MSDMTRREFIGKTVATSGGMALASMTSPWLAATPSKEAEKEKGPLFKISLAQWSLHRRLRGQQEPALDNLDFAKTARDFGIDAVEYVNQFFKDRATDTKYLAEMKKRAADHGVKSLLIMCDGEGQLGDPDKGKRQKAVENHHRWVEAAKFFGCHAIRVNAASSGSRQEQLALAADGLRRLTEFGDSHGIDVIVENHGGLSSDGSWLAAVMERVDHPRCGTLPDFGNFHLGGGKHYDRYKGVKELMPHAKAVSAKSNEFDEKGRETKTNFFKMMRIVLAAGYHGYVGIEYSGSTLGEDEGILATKKLLEKVRRRLSRRRQSKKRGAKRRKSEARE